MQEPQKYTVVSRLLHWGLAALFIGMLGLGLYMSDLEFSPFSAKLYGWHKATGILVLFLVIIRLLWRWTHKVPPLPVDMRAIEKRLARLAHLTLYALMIAMPLSGWLMSSAFGSKVSIFGFFTMPNIAGKNTELAGFFHEAHEVMAYLLIALIVVHILGALYHHFVRKDNVLRRMLFVLPFLVLGFTTSTHAADKSWVMQKDDSFIQFTATVNDAPSAGKFTHYTTDLSLDASDLTQTTGKITVSLTEIDADYPMVGTTLQKKDWFHTAKWPDGVFEITKVTALEKTAQSYRVEGNLTLRETTKPIALTLRVDTQTDDTLVIMGEGRLNRLDFGIGQGEWSGTDVLQKDITLEIQATFKAF